MKISYAVNNVLRNWQTTLPTILVMAIVLTLFHSLLVVHSQSQKLLSSVQQKFSITVYLKDEADPFEIGNLITELEARSDVRKPVVYTSKEQAWQFLSKTFSLDNELLKKYRFSLPASLTITPRALDDTAKIEAVLQDRAKNLLSNQMASKEKQKNIANQMVEFITTIQNATLKTILFFIGIFLAGGALLLSSTIHVAVSTRHREISIMKLVGASHKTIVLPFVAEGVLMSLMAFVLHLIFLLFLPLHFENLQNNFNALLGECIVIVSLAAITSHLTAFSALKRKTSL